MERISIFFLIIFLGVSCGSEVPRQTIPYGPVNFRVELMSYDSELKNPDCYKIFTEEHRRLNSDRFGYAGVLVITDARGNLYAFDLCCPHEDSRQAVVSPDYDGNGYAGKVRCNSCGSVYVTMFGIGNVESGPSSEPLQRYTVIQLQDGSYRVIN
ncbi:Rieske 2Fe-2S domain-containing protein [Proteiniphilum sp. UBA5384]|uniref:Rieske 2Fe-2S domain-containing protein n=1 Tax=Proteiniphilum sp. UBA5384 TaxID=1947279 RepID=UPI0025DF56DF|nr:Rieske 2Fe-2S domain-containing protein [Proteiniphilum sp. UBA5384]